MIGWHHDHERSSGSTTRRAWTDTAVRFGMLGLAGGFGAASGSQMEAASDVYTAPCLRDEANVPSALHRMRAAAPAAAPCVPTHPRSGRVLQAQQSAQAARAPVTHEIVLSRPNREEIAWIFKIPDFWRVTVYSALTEEEAPLWPPDLSPQLKWELAVWPHHAFAEAFAHHLASRYDTLAGYTVFSPAFPLAQSPSLLDMMAHPSMLASVQAMSLRVSPDFPPPYLQEHDRPDAWYRSQRFSLRTLEPTDFTDLHVYKAAVLYRERYGLAQEANIIAHLFGELGIEAGWLAEETEVGAFAYGGIVGFTSGQAQKHSRAVYERLAEVAGWPDPFTLLIERSWLMMLAPGGYREARPEFWRGRKP